MEYLALFAPALVLCGLPLVDRLERWAVGPGAVGPATVGPTTGKGDLSRAARLGDPEEPSQL